MLQLLVSCVVLEHGTPITSWTCVNDAQQAWWDITSKYGNLSWRLNLKILTGSIVDFVTPVTALCSDSTGDKASGIAYVAQNG